MKKKFLAFALAFSLLATAAVLGACNPPEEEHAEPIPYGEFVSEEVEIMTVLVTFTITLAEDGTYTLASSFPGINDYLVGGTYTYANGTYTLTATAAEGETAKTYTVNAESNYWIDDYTVVGPNGAWDVNFHATGAMPYDEFVSDEVEIMTVLVTFTIGLAEDGTYTLVSSFPGINDYLVGGTYTYENGTYTFTATAAEGETAKTYTTTSADNWEISQYTVVGPNGAWDVDFNANR